MAVDVAAYFFGLLYFFLKRLDASPLEAWRLEKLLLKWPWMDALLESQVCSWGEPVSSGRCGAGKPTRAQKSTGEHGAARPAHTSEVRCGVPPAMHRRCPALK